MVVSVGAKHMSGICCSPWGGDVFKTSRSTRPHGGFCMAALEAQRMEASFFNTENRVEITTRSDARKYAIFSVYNYTLQRRGIRIYSEFAAYRCIKGRFRAKNRAFAAKNPRLPGKTPLRPNVLGLRGVCTRSLGLTKMCRKGAKKRRSPL